MGGKTTSISGRHPVFKLKPLSASIRSLILSSGLLGASAARAELPVAAEVWATLGQASREVAGQTMTIHQQTDKAVLNWKSFNIGESNAVNFRQPSASSIALNRIERSDHPSRILGSLSANGQVYLVNPNGFMFGSKSQVNVNSLVATTLNISDEVLEQGLTKAIEQSPGTEPVAAMSGSGELYRKDANGKVVVDKNGTPLKIKIEVDSGAKIQTNARGGRILMVAPTIDNRGTVAAPDGQVILAAATDKVYLQEADPESNLRGILVEVKTGGDVRNLGTLSADRGNVTAMGFAVYQQGRVSASTSVNLNGSVRLLAREGAKFVTNPTTQKKALLPTSTIRTSDSGDGLGTRATVTLAAGSRTEIGLDGSGGTAVNEQDQPASQVEISASRVVMKGGAEIRAPGGHVAITATRSPDAPLQSTSADNDSRILLETGSLIDVSGSTRTVVPMERNVVEVELRSNELRDSPLQKNDILKGQKVRVDIRDARYEYSDDTGELVSAKLPIADITGAVARIQRTVDERNSEGGTVELLSEGDVAIDSGAVIDLSGGSVRYLDGRINTTRLISEGRLYDISAADPDRIYDGIFGLISKTYRRWNVTRVWQMSGPSMAGRFERGYVEGKPAGKLLIRAQNLAMAGQIRAATLDGIHQRRSDRRPDGGRLEIDLAWSGQRQQDIVFNDAQAFLDLGDDDPFPASADGTAARPLTISGELFKHGVRHLRIDSTGRISFAKDSTVSLPSDGSLSVLGGEIEVRGSIDAPSGTVTLETKAGSGEGEVLPGDILVASGAHIDAGGVWVNDQPADRSALDPVVVPIDAGKVAIKARGALTLEQGSSIRVDGGAWLKKDGSLEQGTGGEIALGVGGGDFLSELVLGADLSAYSLGLGGTLRVTANNILVSSAPIAPNPIAPTLAIRPELLDQKGFSEIRLTANSGNLTVAKGETLRLRGLTRELADPYTEKPTGSDIAEFTRLVELPDFLRKPVDLSLAVTHDASMGNYSQDRALAIEEGASILGDPGAVIALSSDANLFVDGTVDAPAGRIDLSLSPVATILDKGFDPNQAIRLGRHASLLSRGVALLQPNPQDLRLGEVKAGGDVVMRASRGYILMDEHARIDVSGTSAVLDIAGGEHRARTTYVPRLIASDGGKISLAAAEGIVLDGSLRAEAGRGPRAAGGSLTLDLDAQGRAFVPENLPVDAPPIPVGPRVIHLSSQKEVRLDGGEIPSEIIPDDFNGQAYLSTEQVTEGGFSALTLRTSVMMSDSRPALPGRGQIHFDSELDLSLSKRILVDAPELAWSPEARGTAGLAAPYVALGSNLNRVGRHDAVTGPGVLKVDADWIDLLGAGELTRFGEARLNSRSDIRLLGVNPSQEKDLVGELFSSGDLVLAARQIYPSTLSRFSIRVDGTQSPDGTVTILPGNPSAATPLSAGGKLTVEAPRIVNEGVLRAPLGELNLAAGKSLVLADGSLTSVSAKGAIIPFGRTEGGLDWLFPIGRYNLVMNEPPSKAIHLSGKEVQVKKGANVDLSGGGDLYAFEFIKGPGGSVDLLDPKDPGFLDGSFSYREKFAVVPWLGGAYAPHDPIEFPSSGLQAGDSIYLTGGNGLPEGRYALLPAHYALLPGAFLVTPQPGTTDLAPGTRVSRLDGTPVISGYRFTADTDLGDARWSGFAVEPGAIARTRAEYQEHLASHFYPQKAVDNETALPVLPRDAGTLSVAADKSLVLAGQVIADAVDGGRGGRLDITAESLAIVQRRETSDEAGGVAVELAADDLNHLNVESILIGGRRSEESGKTRMSVEAQNVSVKAGVQLRLPEIILAAEDRVELHQGAKIIAQGNVRQRNETLLVANADKTASDSGQDQDALYDGSEGALLRVSAGSDALVLRDRLDGESSKGTLWTAEGSVLQSDGAIYLDGTKNTLMQGSIEMNRGVLSLGSGRIRLGDAPAEGDGLVLTSAVLNRLRPDALILNSFSTVDLLGDLNMETRNLTIRSAGLHGFQASGQIARISADTVEFDNTVHGVAAQQQPGGLGRLEISANRIGLGPGEYGWKGFGDIRMFAASGVVASGKSEIDVGSDLQFSAGKFTAEAGADLLLDAGNFRLSVDRSAGSTASSLSAGLGASIDLRAGKISQSGTIELPSGSLRMSASGDVSLESGALVDVGGRKVILGGTPLYSHGGSVHLSSEHGDVSIAEQARIDVSAAPEGGDAGRLSIEAGEGRVSLDGVVEGSAHAGSAGAAFGLEAKAFGADFSALNTKLQNSGFNGALAFRLREGDIVISQGDIVKARDVHITTDTGGVVVQGRIDARGPSGGQVTLEAGDPVRLEHSARIQATALEPTGGGGRVVLASTDADRDGLFGVRIEAGAAIDVSGGNGGSKGSVAVRAERIGAGDAAVDIADGTVIGASAATVEAVQIYRNLPLSNANINQWRDAAAAYMDEASANAALRSRLGQFSLMPGIELQSDGDIPLDLSESLKTSPWSRVGSTNVWTTQLDDVAGVVGKVVQVSDSGSERILTQGTSSTLSRDGTYYFDSDPNSPSFRRLFVRVFPDSSLAGVNRYNPGVIRDTVVESNAWDFLFPSSTSQVWRFGPENVPGIVTLRAAGDLNINQNLSDGFVLNSRAQLAQVFDVPVAPAWLNTLMLQAGPSFSYRLVAGADLASADALAVGNGPAGERRNLVLGSAAAVRTGTGRIDLAASGDIRLTDSTSAIYTAGRPTDRNRYGSFGVETGIVSKGFYAEYPVDGGAITLTAGRDIVGAETPQFMSDWLVRTGDWDPSDGITSKDRPTAWGIAFDNLVTNNNVPSLKFGFRQNVGALGGGDVTIRAGNDIQNLSVMLPSSAKPVGQVVQGQIRENVREVQGGGSLSVDAGGDIAGGVFYVDRGSAKVSAGGSVTGGTQYTQGPVFALGDAELQVNAGRDIAVGTVLNPFFVTASRYTDKKAYFTTYSPESAVGFQASGGHIVLNNDATVIQNAYKVFASPSSNGQPVLRSDELPMLGVYPGNLKAHALSGGLEVTHSFSLFPSANGDLELLSAGDIVLGRNEQVVINQSDVDPARFPSPDIPSISLNTALNNLNIFQSVSQNPLLHANLPVHRDDPSPVRIVSGQGSIYGNASIVSTAEPAKLAAGFDIIGLGLKIQNLDPSNISQVRAGRDIKFPITRDPLTGELKSDIGDLPFEVSGPGQFQVLAGRHVDLGTSAGISTIGNLSNPALPSGGSSAFVLAGISGLPDNERFIKTYLQDSAGYRDQLIRYMRELSGDASLGGDHALDKFKALSREKQLEFVLALLFRELQESGIAASKEPDKSRQASLYRRGQEAIDALFGGADYRGDIKLFFSKIHTVDGGDINLLAPGGSIDVGLASAFSGNKTPDKLGIVAQREGDIGVLVQGDFLVNQSRVFTLDGGDITVWSTDGNIDAGRGAKSSLAVPPPILSFDAKGNVVVAFPSAVSGSGIRAQSGTTGTDIGSTLRKKRLLRRVFDAGLPPTPFGDVVLVAPQGIVDAGEAGIGGRNVAIAATAIIGASNIQATGNLTGTPPAPVSFAASLSSANNLSAGAASSSQAGAGEALDRARDSMQGAKKPVPVSVLTAEVVGFGDCSLSDVRQGNAGCR